MRLGSSRSLSGALAACVLLSAAAQAQVNPFRGSGGRGLSPEDNQLLFESVARLNAATVLRVFHSGRMVCHLVRHRIVVAGRPPARDYRLTWCRTPTGEWKIKS